MNIGDPSNSAGGDVPSRLRKRIERCPTRAERADFGGPQGGVQGHEPLEHEAIRREKGACGVAEHDERAGDGGLRARYDEGSAECRSSVDRVVDDRDSLVLKQRRDGIRQAVRDRIEPCARGGRLRFGIGEFRLKLGCIICARKGALPLQRSIR